MAENKMGEVAKILGLELGEEFIIISNDVTYKITDSGVYFKDDNDMWYKSQILSGLIEGRFDIVKKPWIPKYGDKYYMFMGIDNLFVCESMWADSVLDIESYNIGNCFKTEAEAESHREEFVNKLKEFIWRYRNEN